MPIAETSTVKISWYLISVWLFSYLWIEETQLFILSILMIIDTISWVAKQYKLWKQEITSHNLWAGLLKKVLTLMFLLSFALMLKWIWIEWNWYMRAVLSLLIMWEFYSICQNIYSYMTWKKVNEYDVIALIIRTIWEYILEVIEKQLWKKK